MAKWRTPVVVKQRIVEIPYCWNVWVSGTWSACRLPAEGMFEYPPVQCMYPARGVHVFCPWSACILPLECMYPARGVQVGCQQKECLSVRPCSACILPVECMYPAKWSVCILPAECMFPAPWRACWLPAKSPSQRSLGNLTNYCIFLSLMSVQDTFSFNSSFANRPPIRRDPSV